jgi:magnesium transporter
VQREFGLHDLAIEDAQQAHQRPKVERYGDALFVVVHTAQLAPPGVSPRLHFGETHIFVGRHYIVTVRHGTQQSYADLRARCEASPEHLSLGPGYVLYALLDFLVDQYLPILDAVEDDVARLEEELIGDGDEPVGRHTLRRAYRLKRELLSIKRALGPLRNVSNQLMLVDSHLIPDATRPYYRDVFDQVVRLNELVDNMRELLSTANEISLSLISVDENQDMKRLTEWSVDQNKTMQRLAAWAAIIAVPTMIAGIYGMNFQDMPELRWALGYPFALLLMVIACGALFFGFKRSGWL